MQKKELLEIVASVESRFNHPIADSILNFAKEQGVKRIVLVGANESALLVKDYIKENNIPVILGHIHSMPSWEHSDTRLPFKMAKMFMDEGILAGITYSNTAYGYNLPFVAGQAAVDKEDAHLFTGPKYSSSQFKGSLIKSFLGI